jgi:hypothetical protein
MAGDYHLHAPGLLQRFDEAARAARRGSRLNQTTAHASVQARDTRPGSTGEVTLAKRPRSSSSTPLA